MTVMSRCCAQYHVHRVSRSPRQAASTSVAPMLCDSAPSTLRSRSRSPHRTRWRRRPRTPACACRRDRETTYRARRRRHCRQSRRGPAVRAAADGDSGGERQHTPGTRPRATAQDGGGGRITRPRLAPPRASGGCRRRGTCTCAMVLVHVHACICTVGAPPRASGGCRRRGRC